MYRLRESESKLQSQVQETTRRENVLNMRLATKQEEMRKTYYIIAVNLVFNKCRLGLKESRDKLEQAQNDLSAWKFTPDR
ncbi:pre-mRNA-splicing regulator WTAP-like [Gigantopelta aegis]|uniref:pre-mRNA-splicing regulator WTAP-like n=1 Tax=Gigantopelta aegis TaxID=1735272 RepID=UPI001B88AE1B|nr:pre-mRNA-splicing regulator WTAP-like [Gigantopelta aegis]